MMRSKGLSNKRQQRTSFLSSDDNERWDELSRSSFGGAVHPKVSHFVTRDVQVVFTITLAYSVDADSVVGAVIGTLQWRSTEERVCCVSVIVIKITLLYKDM